MLVSGEAQFKVEEAANEVVHIAWSEATPTAGLPSLQPRLYPSMTDTRLCLPFLLPLLQSQWSQILDNGLLIIN